MCESIHVAGAKTCRNKPIYDETGLLALDSMLARIDARGNQYYTTSMPIPLMHLSIPGRIVDMLGSILFETPRIRAMAMIASVESHSH